MKRQTIKCDKCEKDISKSNFNRHYNSCGKEKNHILEFSTDWIINDKNECSCPYCSKIYSKFGIITHILRKHTHPELYKNCFILSGYTNNSNDNTCWNVGLTKETDERVKKNGETIRNRVISGEIVPHMKGKHHTKETKTKIGKKLTKNNNGGKCKWFSFIKNDGTEIKLQGTWEVRFAKVLEIIDENWIKIGIGNKGHSYIWKDDENIEHYYTPDFYSPKLNKYFEIKGYWWGDDKNKMKKVISQHKNIKIDIIMKKELIEYEKLCS